MYEGQSVYSVLVPELIGEWLIEAGDGCLWVSKASPGLHPSLWSNLRVYHHRMKLSSVWARPELALLAVAQFSVE